MRLDHTLFDILPVLYRLKLTVRLTETKTYFKVNRELSFIGEKWNAGSCCCPYLCPLELTIAIGKNGAGTCCNLNSVR